MVRSAGKGTGAAAIAVAEQQSPAVLDELAELDVAADGEDGLGEASGEDLKIASKVLNMPGVGEDGRSIPPDVFYDTVDRTTKERLDAVLVYLHKTNLYSVFNEATAKTERICQSYDRVTGTWLETGQQRACKGCPDDEWRREEGKPKKNCGPVYNIAAIDRETRMPFWLRFKRTSLAPIKQHLQRHHLGRRIVGGKRTNYPLFAFRVSLSARLSEGGKKKYALPVIDRGEVLTREEMLQCQEAAAAFRENVIPLLQHSDEQIDKSGAVDTSFDTETLGAPAAGTAGAGDDFVE